MREDIKLSNEEIRRKYWIHNAVLSMALRWKKRDSNIWVFGCWEGNRYDDSSKYLFEYVTKNLKTITAYWITKNPEIYKRLASQGVKVMLATEKETRKILLKAGVAFYSNGLDDICNLYYLAGALIIDLNHAPIAAKNVCYFNFKNKRFPIKQLKLLKRAIFNWFYFDYTIVPSEIAKEFWMNSFCINNPNKFLIAGLPRYDVLKGEKYISRELPNFYEKDTHFILYMPTYRKYRNTVIEDFIRSVLNDQEFQDALKNNNYKLVIKPHYAEVFNQEIKSSDSIIVLDSNTGCSTQELLSIAKVLITDYSSCCVDFSVTSNPILMYTPDLEEYIEHNGLAKEFGPIYKSEHIIKDSQQLIACLDDIIKNKKNHIEITKMIYELFNDHSEEGSYSERVANLIAGITNRPEVIE